MKCMQKIQVKKLEQFLKSKGESGISLANNVPYGYKKDENDKTKWVIDETSAEVVKEIYNLFIQGHGTFEIARILTEAKYYDTSRIFYKCWKKVPY